MRNKPLRALVIAIIGFCSVEAETAYQIEHAGVTIQVVEFSKDENHGFELLDDSKVKQGHWIDRQFSEDYLLMANGGYFDGSLNPVGYCKIGSVVHSDSDNPKLSGYLVLDEEGRLDLSFKERLKSAHSVLQCGPYVIDPGGQLGIRSRTGTPAKRTLVALKGDGAVLILSTSEVLLYDLALILKEQIPELDRALNLDGGPSVGFCYGDIRVKNHNPVANFLGKRREVSN